MKCNFVLAPLFALLLLACAKEDNAAPAPDNGTPVKAELQIRVDGGPWITRKASYATRFRDGYYAIADDDGDQAGSYILIRWTGGVGTHPYKEIAAAEGTHAHYLVDEGNQYVPYYIDQTGAHVSGGGVTITSMGDKDGYITGTFLIEPAGYGTATMQQARIEGKFKVKKGW
ncbi:hypothetical protein MKQ70_15150 [Chitinophaga sedimenti]|uniref:hypothetical protein n=1 Tax=Chitinophaga sedimenti TaxID=2033606 RepID=UPI002003ED5D|nr:hypothetical protein [Chitinophaga sedimenti]MCK7556280.1 hypothetical protein [Chitinophaga sedimenti]